MLTCTTNSVPLSSKNIAYRNNFDMQQISLGLRCFSNPLRIVIAEQPAVYSQKKNIYGFKSLSYLILQLRIMSLFIIVTKQKQSGERFRITRSKTFCVSCTYMKILARPCGPMHDAIDSFCLLGRINIGERYENLACEGGRQ